MSGKVINSKSYDYRWSDHYIIFHILKCPLSSWTKMKPRMQFSQYSKKVILTYFSGPPFSYPSVRPSMHPPISLYLVSFMYPFACLFVYWFIYLLFPDLCDKGQSSQDGFDNPNHDACTLCSLGFYQDQYGATQCKQCPSGLTTLAKGSTSLADCGSKFSRMAG